VSGWYWGRWARCSACAEFEGLVAAFTGDKIQADVDEAPVDQNQN
jgi:hypothetical protein